MAGFMDKLKGDGIKNVLLEHAEKIVLGVVALVGLFLIYNARWASEPRTPQSLLEQVQQAEQRLARSTWPEEEQKLFNEKEDWRQEAENLLLGANTTQAYDYSTHMSFPLYKKETPIEEPEFVKVRSLRAIYGETALETTVVGSNVGFTAIETDPNGGGNAAVALNQPASNPDEDFFKRNPTAVPEGVAGNPVPTPNPLDSPVGDAGEGAAAQLGSGKSGRGVRYVALTGIFPLREQLNAIAQSMNVAVFELLSNAAGKPLANRGGDPGMDGGAGNSTASSAVATNGYVEILDFELERKSAVPGPDPWAGDWKPVNIQNALDILNEVSDYDTDEIDPAVTDAVITMPLPLRVMGRWGSRVTHPELQNFVLSDTEKETQNKLNQSIVEKFQKDNSTIKLPPQRRGFARTQIDMGGIRNRVLGGADAGGFLREMTTELSPQNPTDANPELAKLKQRNDAAGQLLLFRYIDFALQPQHAYIYRVRLKIKNPHFNLPPERLKDPTLAHKPFFMTDWSNVTSPVVVPQNSNYFLADVSHPLRSTDDPTATINVYQWYSKVGTTINAKVPVKEGDLIGQKVKTEVLNPAAETFKEEDVELEIPNDALVDIDQSPDLKPDDHPDLALPNKARLRGQLGLIDTVVVVDETGELNSLDPVSTGPTETRIKSRFERQNKAFDYIKQLQAAQTTVSDDSLIANDPDMEMEGGKRPRRTRNPTRVRGRSGAAGP